MSLQESSNNYQPSSEAVKLLHDYPPRIFCGVTGAGKDTMLEHLSHSGRYATVISHTTRQPRENNGQHEVNGVDYWFINEAIAIEMLEAGAFIEAKLNHGRLYGTSVEAFRKAAETGQQVLMEIDIKGVKELMSHAPGLEAIFLVPPDFETWMGRINRRGHLTQGELRTRLTTARQEFEIFEASDGFIPVVNYEIIDTAQSIEDGSYKSNLKLSIARHAISALCEDTIKWLDAN